MKERKKFKTPFHVEHKTPNKMTIKEWAENCQEWYDGLSRYWLHKWCCRIDETAKMRLIYLFQFIKSLKQ